ncbi:hypothetical protein G9A89_002193 [Geosiphon pyriformis]|nr:hypothetical protein G9A89_002193 [Geosiphon pyriformis]
MISLKKLPSNLINPTNSEMTNSPMNQSDLIKEIQENEAISLLFDAITKEHENQERRQAELFYHYLDSDDDENCKHEVNSSNASQEIKNTESLGFASFFTQIRIEENKLGITDDKHGKKLPSENLNFPRKNTKKQPIIKKNTSQTDLG